MADEVIGGVAIEVRGDFSKLAGDFDAAASAAAGIASKFGEGIATAIGGGLGSLLVQNLIASGSLQAVANSIKSTVGGALADIDFSAMGAKISGALGGALNSIDVSGLKSSLSGAFAGVGDAAAAEFAGVQAAATEAWAGVTAGAGAASGAVGGAAAGVAEVAASFGTLATESAAAAGATALTVVELAAVTGGATLAGSAIAGLVLSYSDMIQKQALIAAQSGQSFQTVNTLQGAGSLLGLDPTALAAVFGNLGTSIDNAFSAYKLQNIENAITLLQSIPDPVNRAAAAVQLFGSQAAAALQMANDSTKEAIAQAYDLSTAWDASTRESLQRISDFWTSVKAFFAQTIDLSSGWDQLKQAIVLEVTGMESAVHTFVIQAESDFNDLWNQIPVKAQIAALGMLAVWNAAAALMIPSGGSPQQNLANDAFMQQQQAAINAALGGGGSGLAAQSANPGLYAQAQQVVADNAEIGDSYAALTAAVSSLTAKQQALFDVYQKDPTDANLALAITSTQALIDKDQALIDKTDAATLSAKLLASAWGAVGASNPANAVNNQTDSSGNVTALSPLNAFNALVASGQLQGASLATAFDNVEAAIVKAFKEGAISAETFDADIQKIQDGLAAATGDVANFGVATKTFATPVSSGSLVALLEGENDWAGVAALYDKVDQLHGVLGNINTAWYQQDQLLDQESMNVGSISGDLAAWQTYSAQAASNITGMVAALPTAMAPMQTLAKDLQQSFGLLGSYVNQQVMAPIDFGGFATAKETIQGMESDLKNLMDTERLAGQQVTADQSGQLASLKLMLDGQGDLWNAVNKSVTSVFQSMSSGLVAAAFDWQNFGKDITKTLDSVAQKIVTDLIDNLLLTKNNLNALTTAFTSLLQGGSLSGALSNLGSDLKLGNSSAMIPTFNPATGLSSIPTFDPATGASVFPGAAGATAQTANTTAMTSLTAAVTANTAALAPVTPALVTNTAATVPNTAATAAGAAAALPVAAGLTALAAEVPALATLLATGNVIQAQMVGVSSALLPITEQEAVAEQSLAVVTGTETAAVTADAGATVADAASTTAGAVATGAETAATVADSASVVAGTAAQVANTAAVVAETGASAASAATGAAGGAGGLLSSLGSGLSDLASGGLLGAGIAAAAGITAGIQAEHLNNLMDEVEKSTRGALNQLEDIQGTLNLYLPDLVHLVDIWAQLQTDTMVLDSDLRGLALGIPPPGGSSQVTTSDVTANTDALHSSTLTMSNLAKGVDTLGKTIQTPATGSFPSAMPGVSNSQSNVWETPAMIAAIVGGPGGYGGAGGLAGSGGTAALTPQQGYTIAGTYPGPQQYIPDVQGGFSGVQAASATGYNSDQLNAAGNSLGADLTAYNAQIAAGSQQTLSIGQYGPTPADTLTSTQLSNVSAALSLLIGLEPQWTQQTVAATVAALQKEMPDQQQQDYAKDITSTDLAAYLSKTLAESMAQMPAPELQAYAAAPYSVATVANPTADINFAPSGGAPFSVSSLSTALTQALAPVLSATRNLNVTVNTVNPLTAFAAGVRNVGVKL